MWPEWLEDFVDVYGKGESPYNSEPAKAVYWPYHIRSTGRFVQIYGCGASKVVSELWNEPSPASEGFFFIKDRCSVYSCYRTSVSGVADNPVDNRW